jgi:PIF1-like helicase
MDEEIEKVRLRTKSFIDSKSKVSIDYFGNTAEENKLKLNTFIAKKNNIIIIREDGYANDGGYSYGRNESVVLKNTQGNFLNTVHARNQDLANFVIEELRGERTAKEFIKSGDAKNAFKTLTKKIRDSKHTMGELSKPEKLDKEVLKKFTKKEKEIIVSARSMLLDSNVGDIFWPTKMTFGSMPKNVKRINTPMKEGLQNCVCQILEEKFGYDIIEDEYLDGVDYDDIPDLIETIEKKTGRHPKINIKNRNNDIIESFQNEKYKGKIKKSDIVDFYQLNHHATVSLSKIDTRKLKHEYLSQDELHESFIKYPGYDIYAVGTRKDGYETIIAWWNNETVYLIDDSRINREIYPHAMTYVSTLYSEFKKIAPGIPKDHALKEFFQNSEKYCKIARPAPYGMYNEIQDDATMQIIKIDRNRAYTNYFKCSEYLGYMIAAPSENIYECTTEMFLKEKLEGIFFVRDIIFPFRITDDDAHVLANGSIGINATEMYLAQQDGRMMAPELRYILREGGSVDIYAFIPCRKVKDELKDFLKKIPVEFKKERNALIGNFVSHQEKDSIVSNDIVETQYYVKLYEGKSVDVAILEDKKFIININNDEFSHGLHTHVYDYIMSCHRVNMWEKMAEIIKLGGIVIASRTDSIKFQIRKDIKHNFLKGFDKKNEEWKYEEIGKIKTEYPSMKKPFVLEEELYKGKKWQSFLNYQLISLEGPGGVGKSYLVNHTFKHAGMLAPTNSAAKNLNNGMTIDMYMIHLQKFSATPYQTIIIDEASMIPLNQIRKLDLLLKKFHNNVKPFGGIQIVLSGDPAQIEPTKIKGGNEEKMIYMTDDIKDFYRDYKFEGCYRFKDDIKYGILLNEFREAILTNNKSYQIEALRNISKVCRVQTEFRVQHGQTHLVYTNALKDKLNDNHVKTLDIKEPNVIIRENKYGLLNGDLGILKNGIIHSGDKCVNASDIEHQYAYAITSHIAQGQTLRGEVLLHVSKMQLIRNMRCLYVALSRATTSKNVVIIAPKDDKIFN